MQKQIFETESKLIIQPILWHGPKPPLHQRNGPDTEESESSELGRRMT